MSDPSASVAREQGRRGMEAVFVVGLASGAALVWALGRGARAADRARTQELLADRDLRLAELRREVEASRARESDLRRDLAEVGAQRAALTASLQGEQRAVESAGLIEHCDFCEQVTVPGEDGAVRPDMVIRLPAGRSILVDAKAPLDAYLDAAQATDEARRDARLRDHASQVRQHVQKLSRKTYWTRF